MLKSLGLIETLGLTVGITAADAAVKSANVALVGYELAKGSGRTVIKVEGDVGAVKAAVEAAQAAALQVGGVAAVKVIARPSDGLEMMIRNGDTVGYTAPKEQEQKSEEEPRLELSEEINEPGTGSKPVSEPVEAAPPMVVEVIEPAAEPEQEVAEAAPAEEAAEPAVQQEEPVKPEKKTETKSETAQKNTKKGNKPRK